MRPIQQNLSFYAADPNGISTAQTPAENADLTLDGALVSGGVATLSTPGPVTLTSTDDFSAVTFTMVQPAATVTWWLASSLAPPPLAVSVTVYVPGARKTCDGLCALLEPPSPKSQLQAVAPVDASENATARPATPAT